MIRTKGEAGTGILWRPCAYKSHQSRDSGSGGLPVEEITSFAKANAAYELALKVKELGRLPVVNFAAGGIATPLMQPHDAVWL